MKNFYVFLIFSCLAAIIVTSCNKEIDSESLQTPTETTEQDVDYDTVFSKLVEKFNDELLREYGPDIREVRKGFVKKGVIKSKIITNGSEGESFISVTFRSYSEDGRLEENIRLFNFGLENIDDINEPPSFKNGQIAFFRNQLILRDLNSNKIINLFIPTHEGSINDTPELSTITGEYLSTEITSYNSTAAARGSCSCNCVASVIPGGTSACGCTCGNSACWVMCRSGYRAECPPSGACQ